MTLPTKRRLSFVKPSNPKRRKAKYARNYGVDGRRGESVRAMPCVTTRSTRKRASWCHGRVHASHVVPRGMGGVKGDARSLVPHCESCHRWWENDPKGYEQSTGLNMAKEAARIAADLDRSLGPEPCYLCGETSGHSPMCKSVEARR